MCESYEQNRLRFYHFLCFQMINSNENLTFSFFYVDIGAGDGEVTMRLVKGIMHMKNNIFLKVFVTEYSWTMRDRLQEKQFM